MECRIWRGIFPKVYLVYINSLISFKVMNSGSYLVTKDARSPLPGWWQCLCCQVSSLCHRIKICNSLSIPQLCLISVIVVFLEWSSDHTCGLIWCTYYKSLLVMKVFSLKSSLVLFEILTNITYVLLSLREATWRAVCSALSCSMLIHLALRDLRSSTSFHVSDDIQCFRLFMILWIET